MDSRRNSLSTITTDRPVQQQRLSIFKCILESFTHYESKLLDRKNKLKI
jgi:hypothetical protein